jgi:hypothetical protein
MAALSLTVKSMAGNEFKITDLTDGDTIIALKRMITKCDEKFSPNATRLLYKGKELGVDEQLLRDAGVVDGSDLFIVLRLQGRAPPLSPRQEPSAPPPRQPPPATLRHQSSSSGGSAFTGQAEGGIMRAQVPANHGRGVPLRLMVPGRGVMQVTVPAGVGPGETFTFRVPPAQQPPGQAAPPPTYGSESYNQEYRRQSSSTGLTSQGQSAAAGGQLLTVAATVAGGQTMRVQVVGRGTMQVTVPANVQVGENFLFRI